MKKHILIMAIVCVLIEVWAFPVEWEDLFVDQLMQVYAMAPENSDCLDEDDEEDDDFQPLFPTAEALLNFSFPSNMPYASWTPAQRLEVLERYIRRISERETDISRYEYELTEAVIRFCDGKNVTNCLNSARMIIRRRDGSLQYCALEYVFGKCVPSLEINSFAHEISTNRTSFSEFRRHEFSGKYIKSLCETNVSIAIRQDAAARFYPTRAQHHLYYELDPLLVATWPDYATSTNRLHFAEEALTSPEVDGYWATYFESVTNQLHQAGL